MSVLNIAVALPCEARPFIELLKLHRCQINGITVYVNQIETVYLVVTGIGALNMASGVGFLHAYSSAHASTIYLNSGIAGSNRFTLGELVWLDQIKDEVTEKTFYPFTPSSIHLPRASCVTVAQPHVTYDYEICDMEAAAFYQASNRFVSADLIYSLKLISDTPKHPVEQVDKKMVLSLYQEHFAALDSLLQKLVQSSLMHNEVDKLGLTDFRKQLLESYHFSHSQQLQLDEQLRRVLALQLNTNLFEIVEECRTSKAIIGGLKQYINQQVYEW